MELYKAKDGKGSVYQTNILDPYPNAAILQIYDSQEDAEVIYRIINDRNQYILRTMNYQLSFQHRVKELKNSYDQLATVAEETKTFLKPIDFQDSSLEEICVEILYESYESNLMEIIERADARQVLEIAKETLNCLIKAKKIQCSIKPIPENIVLNGNKLKLIDFNLSKNVSVYNPPELQEEVEITSFDKIDVYYWGMTMYQLMTRKSLNELREEAKKYRSVDGDYAGFLKNVQQIILANDPEKEVTTTMISILLKVFNRDPSMRPSYEEIQSSLNKIKMLSKDSHKESTKGNSITRGSPTDSGADAFKFQNSKIERDNQTSSSNCINNDR